MKKPAQAFVALKFATQIEGVTQIAVSEHIKKDNFYFWRSLRDGKPKMSAYIEAVRFLKADLVLRDLQTNKMVRKINLNGNLSISKFIANMNSNGFKVVFISNGGVEFEL